MASQHTPTQRRPQRVETESAVFAKVAALLLGILVAVLGFLALLMWADAREARGATAPASDTAAQRDVVIGCVVPSGCGVLRSGGTSRLAGIRPHQQCEDAEDGDEDAEQQRSNLGEHGRLGLDPLRLALRGCVL